LFEEDRRVDEVAILVLLRRLGLVVDDFVGEVVRCVGP